MVVLVARARKALASPASLGLAAGVAGLALLGLLNLAWLSVGAAEEAAASGGKLFSARQLESLAPAELAGLPRRWLRSETSTGMNVPAVALDARFESDGRSLTLKVVQSSELQRVVGFGGPDTGLYDRKSEGGRQRRWREGAAILTESLTPAAGAFGRLEGDVYVLVQGESGVAADSLRAAAKAVADRVLRARDGGG